MNMSRDTLGYKLTLHNNVSILKHSRRYTHMLFLFFCSEFALIDTELKKQGEKRHGSSYNVLLLTPPKDEQ